MKRIDNEHGFTILDIIIGICILAIFSVMVLSTLTSQVEKKLPDVMLNGIMPLAKSQEKFIIKNPTSFGTTSQEELRIAYFKGIHKDVNLGIVVKEDIGYCLIGTLNNNNSEQKNIWYDSARNDFVDTGEKITSIDGGACNGISPDSPNITWLK